MTVNARKNPVILCHAACTGGSLIYRLLVLSFGFIGISEVSHETTCHSIKFLPFDPEGQLYLQGIISSENFSDVFFNRLCRCNDIICSAGKRMLIREHSHSYFFNMKNQKINNDINSISWTEGRYKKISKESLYCLLSVRDPIDSWLGLRQNFPKEKNSSFDKYCEMYLNFLKLSEQTKNIHVFKYEEMVKNPKNTLLEISKKIDSPLTSVELKSHNFIQSSGNSGRLSSDIYIRPRRPFTNHLVDAAKKSIRYGELCERLGYETLQHQIKFRGKVSILKNQINNYFYIIFNSFKKSISFEFILD